jgi:hypothetical protein
MRSALKEHEKSSPGLIIGNSGPFGVILFFFNFLFVSVANAQDFTGHFVYRGA